MNAPIAHLGTLSSMAERTWTDEQLAAAIKENYSWRQAQKALGLRSNNSNVTRIVRKHADRLGLDYSHFRRNRSWSDDDLRQAAESSEHLSGVMGKLGLSSTGGNTTLIRQHCLRLGITLPVGPSAAAPLPAESLPFKLDAAPEHLRQAATLLAAAWFTERGHQVSWPLEPTTYDLVVESEVGLVKVQVKTSNKIPPKGKGSAYFRLLRRDGTEGARVVKRRAYTLKELDYFFLIGPDRDLYLVPLTAVLGKETISTSKLTNFKVS